MPTTRRVEIIECKAESYKRPEWYCIGIRDDGSKVHLSHHWSLADAEQRADYWRKIHQTADRPGMLA